MIVPNPDSSIADLVTGAAWDGETLAAEIADRAGRLAARGVGAGDRILIAHGGTPAFFADLFAVWRLGACAACANSGLAADELKALIALVRPAAILAAAPVTPAATLAGPPVLCLSDGTGPAVNEPAQPAPGDPALILFTSGSTGVPKGVVLSFGALTARLSLNRANIEDGPLARTLNVLPTHFGHGLIGNCLTPLAAGGALFLMAGNSIRTAATLGATIDAHDIGFMSSVPSLWRMALKMSPPPDAGTLRRVHIGSAPLSAELWHAVIDWSGGAEVVNMYGLTETANWAAGASARDHAPADGLVGQMWGGEAAVQRPDGRISAGGEGQILLRTPGRMLGYLGDGSSAKAAADEWLATGDTGTIDPAGVIRLTGRTRTEINRAGIKVHPEEIELMLERHPGISEACAFPVPDPVAGETIGVAVAPANGSVLDPSALADWCAGRIRREARPERWHIVSAIPKNDRGKPDRRAVRSTCLAEDLRR